MKILIFLFFLASNIYAEESRTPSDYWKSIVPGEKVAFINGAYAAGAKLKYHHKQEVKKQYMQDLSWVQPYYIDRFYAIVDEHRSKEAGYDVEVIAKAMDAFYSNFDNSRIPLLEALRIVSLGQDGHYEKANLYLLKAQRKFNP